MEQIHRLIVEQLRDFAENAGFSDCVIGLSGGLDSSVVAALCTETFGPAHVHGVLLPGPFSSDHSIEDALELARNLGLETDIISITEPYEAFSNELEAYFDGGFTGVVSENAQARIRMIMLMAFSNAHNWMLVNTGNRSEAYMGYCTLYGDMAGAYAPIGGLYKTQVYDLAREINSIALDIGGLAPIPQRVLEKAPSAELAEDQTDEAGLGIGYAELDRILAGHFDEGRAPSELASDTTPLAQVEELLARAKSFDYKRALLPPCAVIE
ncbi:MAG: NAD(+) synthase [Eggerthellaceae bacterium]|nr:NAD(+) synthase [Eggerthellaceae bacterium]